MYGHVVHESSFPDSTSEETADPTRSILEQTTANEYPHLAEMGVHALGFEYSFDNEFEFGLDLILDALDRTAT